MAQAAAPSDAPSAVPSVERASDYQALAQARLNPAIWRHLQTGDDATRHDDVAAFADYRLLPRPLRDLRGGHTRLTLFGQTLAHPLLLGEFAFRMAASALDACAASFLANPFVELYIVTIAAGYLSTAIVGLMGLARRRLLHEAWILALTPLYWVCLSIAAWRALYQLLREPYRWEKTEHGLARSSRLAQQKRKSARSAAARQR